MIVIGRERLAEDHGRESDLELAIDRTEAWLRSQSMASSCRGAAQVHAAALARVCGCVSESRPARGLFADISRDIRPGDLLQVDPLTAILANAPATSMVLAAKATAKASGHSLSSHRLIEWLAEGPQGARQAVCAIETASDWGACELEKAPLCCELLQGVALAAARSFNLIFAHRSARASVYCSHASQPFRRSFVLFTERSQDPDGAFLSTQGVVPASREDPELAFIVRCAASVQALWTLKELTVPGFRLMRRIGLSE
ncbi:hypothetical protein [Bradyrhizobium amphicarpaeae]|uniref:Uncharacterized protein n=1 Tax=Bradyrhizobium amphicarpaeae TaxID=1404768 RepID=A0A2U8Q0V3_9BRAD|nr:hypothetical protein [Bradyrhizobium amphicarpaeae]AWM03415.1 hypothetical protein CIT40_27490 [Bradyrhizobium amphicarpaeae]